jgi:CRP-like cAMP-binding protein
LEIGKVKLYASNGFSFITYREGDVVGDSDALLGELRDSKATALIDCTLHSIKIESI